MKLAFILLCVVVITCSACQSVKDVIDLPERVTSLELRVTALEDTQSSQLEARVTSLENQ